MRSPDRGGDHAGAVDRLRQHGSRCSMPDRSTGDGARWWLPLDQSTNEVVGGSASG
ncbi:MAG: hypothetical protein JNK05_20550 [Myxococcales bacterium]|nr:hypothetical protein [Myxococcales bacterium]